MTGSLSVAASVSAGQGAFSLRNGKGRYTGAMESAPGREAGHPRINLRRRDAGFFAVSIAIVAADQFVKWVIRQWLALGETHDVIWPLSIIHVTNSGAAFGILQGAGPL